MTSNYRIVLSIIPLILVLFMNSSSVLSVTSVSTNRTLTHEELNQIEKEPIFTLENCEDRSDFDPNGLCLAYYKHLQGKCSRLDFLPTYCGAVVKYNFSASVYQLNRSIQQQCIQELPLPNQTELVKICKDYLIFGSEYYVVPPEVKINRIDIKSNESSALSVEEFLKKQASKSTDINDNPVLVTLNMTIKNRSIGGIHVEGISYDIIQKGNVVLSDRIGSSQESCVSNYIGCVSYSIGGLTDYPIVREVDVSPGSVDLNDPKYLVNGTMEYENDNSGQLTTQMFSAKYP